MNGYLTKTNNMDYTAETREWTLNEFIRSHRVPCMTIVTQGFCGETQHNVLDKGQILRIQGIYTEYRLQAKILKDSEKTFGGAAMTVSIPISCDIPVFVIKKGNISRNPTFLNQLDYKLPFDVQMDTSRNTVCQIRSGTEHYSIRGAVQVRLFERHCMNYIYGNPVNKDVIYGNVISILVDDCDAKLSLVTGLVSGDTEYYNHLMQQMTHAVNTYVNFKEKVGHRDMFVSSYIKLKNDDIKIDSRKPKIYSKERPMELFVYVKPNPVIMDNHIYEEIKDNMRNPAIETSPRPTVLSDMAVSSLPSEHDIHLKDNKSKIEPILQNVRMSCVVENFPAASSCPGFLPPIPKRPTEIQTAKTRKPLPVPPQDETKPGTKYSPETISTTSRLSTSDVGKLTIEELSQYLHSLNLSRYVDQFKAQQVDGCLLQELDETLLQDEFGLTRFESIKLTKFAKTGYMPQFF